MTRRRAERKAAPPVAECAIRVRPSAQAWAVLGGICWRVLAVRIFAGLWWVLIALYWCGGWRGDDGRYR